MLARPFAVFIAVACCCFSSCATPRTSQGFIDVDGDGLGDSVVELKLAEDKDAPVESLVIGNAIFRPFRAATYLASLIDLREVSPPSSPKSDETSQPRT